MLRPFLGVYPVNAEPMSLGDYYRLRGWSVPSGENPNDDGYLVERVYPEKQNHPDYKGHISWQGKEEFEKAHRIASAMSFGFALEAIKNGQRVSRLGWIKEGTYLMLFDLSESHPIDESLSIDQVRGKPRPSGRGRIARTPKASYTALMMTSIGEDGAK